MILNQNDQLALLHIIRSGNYKYIFSLSVNFDDLSNSSYILRLKENERAYKLSKNISNILFPSEPNNLKRLLTNLVASELIYYNNTRQQTETYIKLKKLAIKLAAFSLKKRFDNFLRTFVKASKALQDVVMSEKNLFVLKILKNLIIEVRKNVDST